MECTHVRRALLGAALAAALVAAGCGSSDDDSAGTATATVAADAGPVAELQDQIERLEQRPTSIGIDEPIDGGIAHGKEIVYLSCGVPACVELGESLEEATDAVGWKLRTINQGLAPEEVKAAWEQVARMPPDAVVTTGGFPTSIFGAELAELKKAGGVMVSVADVAPPEPEKGYIAAVAGAERSKLAGRQMADWVVAETGGDASVQMINASGFPTVNLQYEEFERRLNDVCPDCTMKTYDAPLTAFGKDLPQRVAQQLRTNPGANALVLGAGDMAIGLPDALAGAGITDPPPAITQGQTPVIAQVLEQGGLAAIYGQEVNEVMWRAVDILGRHFAGQSLEPDVEADVAVQWLLTAENIPSTTEPFPLVEDYAAQYEALWGID
ncbi:MAG: substrate-binding domain-containing protein [Solirubrobacterales bacterium]|nr:substrate-binding domain-containing protein [Solirubrobacterales bacterium]